MEGKNIIIFLTGFFSCALIFYLSFYIGQEVPFISGMASLNNISPSNWINEGDIMVYDDIIVLKIPNATISHYAATGSMKPVLDYNSNGIRIVPQSPKDIGVGDIVSFKRNGVMIVHRVVGLGTDEKGPYFITQGDNTLANDGKVRFEEIRFVTIGILW